MELNFWLSRWQNNEIGFHKTEPNRYLKRFFNQLQLSRGNQFFVPLCGKSVDLNWLAQCGMTPIGVEASEVACRAFFDETGQEYELIDRGPFRILQSQEITLYCGDFFDLSANETQHVRGVFDRGALVALPQPIRQRYVEHLSHLLPTGSQILLVAIEYEQAQMHGPPFSVMETEIGDLYGKSFSIRRLLVDDVLADNPHIQERGVISFIEKIYLLERK